MLYIYTTCKGDAKGFAPRNMVLILIKLTNAAKGRLFLSPFAIVVTSLLERKFKCVFSLSWCENDRKEYPTNKRRYEPRYEKTGFLHMRKQRRRSASQ